ncbi:conserved hypothetical protein [Trichinella spiralis]|uniref:hypothetical protein n=1 Tax=Trichinella spiralis TaxID=6334 RepID=UPI0001EFC606|nr:conserved hypothetical protein [Trichinella spiralis]
MFAVCFLLCDIDNDKLVAGYIAGCVGEFRTDVVGLMAICGFLISKKIKRHGFCCAHGREKEPLVELDQQPPLAGETAARGCQRYQAEIMIAGRGMAERPQQQQKTDPGPTGHLSANRKPLHPIKSIAFPTAARSRQLCRPTTC